MKSSINNYSDKILTVVLEGPIAFDGKEYRYSRGEALYLHNLARSFKKIRIAAYVLKKGDIFYESCIHSSLTSNKIEIIELPSVSSDHQLNIFSKIKQFFLVFKLLNRAIDKSTDLLYLFLPSYPSALAWIVNLIKKKKYFIYGADDWEQASESMFKWGIEGKSFFFLIYSKINSFLERRILRGALFSVAAGGLLVEKYSRFGAPAYPTTPRMTLSSKNIFERDDTCQGKTINLINVGSLIEDKAQQFLIHSFNMICPKHQNLKLTFIGEGPKGNELFELTKSLGLQDKVNFLGFIEEENELYEQLKKSDIFVLSSITEGFPRVLYESMAMRLPVITTDVGGIPYLLEDQKSALIVPSKDEDSLAIAMDKMITNGELRRSIIRNASGVIDGIFDNQKKDQISNLLSKHLD